MEPEPGRLELSGEDPGCKFRRCICCWISSCSSRIPPVAPGRDYDRVPLDADGQGVWSLLIGFLPPSSPRTSPLCLRRFSVAASGRVFGRSNDVLEILDDLDYDAKGGIAQFSSPAAVPAGSSLHLCLFCLDFDEDSEEVEPPRPLKLLLSLKADKRITRKISYSLPALPPRPFMPIVPISAGGELWAPCFGNHVGPTSLVMLRLHSESKPQWVQVASMEVEHCIIHGYAVVHDTILLSLAPQQPFVVFDCTTCTWSAVKTDKNCSTFAWTVGKFITDYVPIRGRGLYIEEDDTIYFLRDNIIYAYKLCKDQDKRQYHMALPTIIDRLSPFGDEGSGFLTHLFGQVLCFVWICKLHCHCDFFHVLITTFRVIGDSGSNREHFNPKGVQVLHSTCRRLDIDPSNSSGSGYTFCFLQEYEENALPPAKKKRENEMTPSMSLESIEVTASSSKMPTCCRDFFNQKRFICALRLENSVIQTAKDLYIICQSSSCSTVFKINIMDGRLACHNQNLKPYSVMDTFVCDDPDDLMEPPFPWHFVCDGTSIYAVPGKKNDIHVLGLAKGTTNRFESTKPAGIDFSIHLVVIVGLSIIALTDTLGGVYHLSETHEWERHIIQGSVDLEKKVNLSGYVVLSDKSFMVCDAVTNCWFLFDMGKDEWSVITSYYPGWRGSEFLASLPIQPYVMSGSLSGRSVFVEGFIYTCADGGLEAYEYSKLEDNYYLGKKISLQFEWLKYWDSNRMCLDYVGQDATSGAVMFCVVQGNNYDPRPGLPHKHPVLITTIQVKTERTHRDTWKPVAVGHVNISTSLIPFDKDGEPIWTCRCFAPH